MNLLFPSRELISSYGAIPTKYYELHFASSATLARQLARKSSRGEELSELRRDAFPIYGSSSLLEIRNLLRKRATPWYESSVGPLLSALGGQSVETVFFLSVANNGSDERFEDNDILEIPYVVLDGKMQRRPLRREAPEAIANLTRRFVVYERDAAAAIHQNNLDLLVFALEKHPWVQEPRQARLIAEEIMKQEPP